MVRFDLGPLFFKNVGTFPGLNFPGISIHFILFIHLLEGETTFLKPLTALTSFVIASTGLLCSGIHRWLAIKRAAFV